MKTLRDKKSFAEDAASAADVGRVTLDHLRLTQSAILAQIPGVQKAVEDSFNEIDNVLKGFAITKDLAAQMCSWMGELDNQAIAAAHGALFKKETVDAILDLCLLGAVDVPPVADVTPISSEIISQYGEKSSSNELRTKADAAQVKCDQIKAVVLPQRRT
ncbi:hypothetical protein LTR65_009779 [Meristemomyces frigidus]